MMLNWIALASHVKSPDGAPKAAGGAYERVATISQGREKLTGETDVGEAIAQGIETSMLDEQQCQNEQLNQLEERASYNLESRSTKNASTNGAGTPRR